MSSSTATKDYYSGSYSGPHSLNYKRYKLSRREYQGGCSCCGSERRYTADELQKIIKNFTKYDERNVCRVIKREEANVNAVDDENRSFLFRAYLHERMEVADVLREHGAQICINEYLQLKKKQMNKITLTNISGKCYGKHSTQTYNDFLRLFLEHTKLRTKERNRLFKMIDYMSSIDSDIVMIILNTNPSKDIVEELIEKIEDINYEDKHGETLLFKLVKLGYNLKMVKLAVKEGAEIDITNKEGVKILVAAHTTSRCMKDDDLSVVEYIRDHTDQTLDEDDKERIKNKRAKMFRAIVNNHHTHNHYSGSRGGPFGFP